MTRVKVKIAADEGLARSGSTIISWPRSKLRLQALKNAGQRDMFAAPEPCAHEWLRPDNGSIECAVCGATRNHYGE